MSLHRVLTLFVIVVAGLALGAAVALVMLTTYLHRTTVQLETGLQSVRLAEEMQIDLLEYIRTRDQSHKTRVERDLRRKLREAHKYASSAEEAALLNDVERRVEAHFVSSRNDANASDKDKEVEEAFQTLRQFIDLNVSQAEETMRESENWDQIGDRLGMGFSMVLIVGIAAMLIWLSRVAFQPVFEIGEAIRGFAAGRKETRAPERGPEELRTIAKQFNDMAVALERQYEHQLSFLAAVAHDLRNPIGVLKGSADILLADRKLPPEMISKLMTMIKRQVDGMDRMIGDLLDTARIEAGRLELRISECDARTIAQNAFDLFNSASTERDLTIVSPDEPTPLSCDPLRIEQVLNNLISNAVKYSTTGTKIELSLEPVDDEVQFTVSDEGVGIAKQELPYIFEPFRRSPASKDSVPGVGLGLSVAQRIVSAHGGRIQVESQVGRGTIFRVRLPAHHSPAEKLSA